MEELLTIQETAAYLKKSPRSVNAYIKKGGSGGRRLKAYRVGREYRIPRQAIEKWIKGD